MPVDRKRYPPDWEKISISIRKRSKNKCECTGECGTHSGRCNAENYQPHPITNSKVILTVAHLGIPYPDGRPGNKHDKMDVRRKNLKAMCQRCHLIFDLPEHKENAARTRHLRKLQNGQLELIQRV